MIKRLWSPLLGAAISAVIVASTACFAAPRDQRAGVEETEVASVEEAEVASVAPLGRWSGDEVCLELFANGDFEITLKGRGGPKQLVMGRAEATAAREGSIALNLSVTRIWKGRFMGPCRKVHELGGWVESAQVLGVDVAPEGSASLTVRRTSDETLELCGSRCVPLTRDEPLLSARWRRSGLESPSRPESPWKVGDLLEINIDDTISHVWAGTGTEQFATVYGETRVRALDTDRFEVTFVPNGTRSVDDSETVLLFGAPLPTNARRDFSARRLAGQRLEVCEGPDHCVTLERQFDAYRY